MKRYVSPEHPVDLHDLISSDLISSDLMVSVLLRVCKHVRR